MTPGPQTIISLHKTSGTMRCASSGIVLLLNGSHYFLTTSFLGSPETHTFELAGQNKRLLLNPEKAPHASAVKAPILLLRIPDYAEHFFASTVTNFLSHDDIRLGMDVSCMRECGYIDETRSWIRIIDNNLNSTFIGERLIRVRMSNAIHASHAGSPLIVAGTSTAAGIVVAQSAQHIYACPADELSQIGQLVRTHIEMESHKKITKQLLTQLEGALS